MIDNYQDLLNSLEAPGRYLGFLDLVQPCILEGTIGPFDKCINVVSESLSDALFEQYFFGKPGQYPPEELICPGACSTLARTDKIMELFSNEYSFSELQNMEEQILKQWEQFYSSVEEREELAKEATSWLNSMS